VCSSDLLLSDKIDKIDKLLGHFKLPTRGVRRDGYVRGVNEAQSAAA